MSYCSYHPLEAANCYCPECDKYLCRRCVDDAHQYQAPRCVLCGEEVETVGATVDVEPFWRRFDKSIRYPMTVEVGVMITVISVLTAALSFAPLFLALGLSLLCAGVMTKYAFNCLAATATGKMSPPDIVDAYSGGVLVIFKLIFVYVIISLVVGLLFSFISPALGVLSIIFVVVGFPAMMILFGMSENVVDTINPLKILSLMTSIGFPYLLILGVLMIMMGSVAFLSALIGTEQTFIKLVLQSSVSNYYMIVMFHLMGYMIFQYQHQLGFVAESDEFDARARRSDSELARDKAQVLVKEGLWEEASKDLAQALKKYPEDQRINEDRFLLAIETSSLASGEKQNNSVAFDDYLSFLVRSGAKGKLYLSYSKARAAYSQYQPSRPELRFEVAKLSRDVGNSKAAVKLLLGLHKEHPKFPFLVSAYELLAESLDDLPGENAKIQSRKCRMMVERLKQIKSTARKNGSATASPEVRRVETTPQAATETHPDGDILEIHESAEKDLSSIDFKL